MIQILDGPAEGQALALKRAPFFLRVVLGPKGDWDALDQLEDRASADEQVFAYYRVGPAGRIHILASGRHRSATGWYALAQYRLCETQPLERELRETAAWREWTRRELKVWRERAAARLVAGEHLTEQPPAPRLEDVHARRGPWPPATRPVPLHRGPAS